MPATSTFRESLVSCDVVELKRVPSYSLAEGAISLKGASPSQINFAASIRGKKLKEWEPDLPENVWAAIHGISDSAWWIANQNNDSSQIRWPASWAADAEQPELASYDSGDPKESSRKLVSSQANGKPRNVNDQVFDSFEEFARKICTSKELSYLTMMAMLYHQTGSKVALEKFKQARQTIQGHLDAIDKIVGPID